MPTQAPTPDGDDAPGPALGEARDVPALDELYDQHAGAIERWVRRLGGPRADVEDLMHDVFVVAIHKRRQLRPDGNPRAWLFQITRHVLLTRRRRDRVRGWLFARFTEDTAAAARLPSTPAEEIERRQDEARLYAALDRLPESSRTALILYELEGLSGEEIAALMGAEVNTIWVRLHRGRARLHTLLRGEGGR